MQRGRVLNLSSLNFKAFVTKNSFILTISVLFLAGFAFGTAFCNDYPKLYEFSKNFLSRFLEERTDNGFFQILLNSFINSLLFLGITFVVGTSMMGVVLSPATVALRGFMCGCLMAYIYSVYSLKGIAFNAVVLIPCETFFAIALVLASIESVKFSFLLAKLTLPRSAPVNLYFEFKSYCAKYALYSLTVLLSSLLDALISRFFLGSFLL